MTNLLSVNDIQNLDSPLILKSLRGKVFDGETIDGNETLCILDIQGNIKSLVEITEKTNTYIADATFSNELMILPGGIDLHVHGRDVWEDEHSPVKGTDKDQTHKEDSYTLSLSLAQGGAVFALCMPNLGNPVVTEKQFLKQVKYINSEQSWRAKPILPLSMYSLIIRGSKPFKNTRALYKLMWNTFGPTNLNSDKEVFEVLRPYRYDLDEKKYWITAHCETITDILEDKALPHHVRRQKKAAVNAVKLFLEAAKQFKFHPHIAHISSAEEVALIRESQQQGYPASCEVTPQALLLDYETFESSTIYPLQFGQQNPPLRSFTEKEALQACLQRGEIDFFATDHAPHTLFEKEQGMSGMPQASSAGQLYLELVAQNIINLNEFIRYRSLEPSRVLEEYCNIHVGRIKQGYHGSFTIVSKNKHTISNEGVTSKCGWTPYHGWQTEYSIEGVVIKGVLYSSSYLKKLKTQC